MGWDNASPVKAMMSTEQRNLIIMLRERIDGVSQGTYAADQLPPWSKFEAIREINKLNERLNNKRKTTALPFHTKCPFCSSVVRPCCGRV